MARTNRIIRSALAALLTLALTAPFAAQAEQPAGQLDALQAMLQRRSIRVFDPAGKVSDKQLGQVIQAGWNTRTLDGSQPFEFITIRDGKKLAELSGATRFAKWLAKAPAAIAVVVRTDESPRLFKENGSLAVLNMYYKAQELGLGTVFQGTANRKAMKKMLGLGKNRHLLSVIPVGVPRNKAPKSPKRASLEQTVWAGTIGGSSAKVFANTEAKQKSGRNIGAFLGSSHQQVERYANKKVDGNTLRTAFEAMRSAPSSKNRQPWRWVLVKDKATKQRIAKAAKDKTLADAPYVAVLAGATKPPPARFGSQLKHDPHNNVAKGTKLTHFFLQHDVALALGNLRLGLESQGLGARVATFNARSESKVRAALSQGRPVSKSRMHMVAAVGIGYAAKSSTRTVKPMPSRRWSKR
jgi:nitroreductase